MHLGRIGEEAPFAVAQDGSVLPTALGVDAAKRRAIGGNIEVIGTPEQVVDQFLQLRKAGIDGLQLSFFDFQPDLEFFGERVIPLMEQAGLRLKVEA
jgi:FMNH2-dependent dimethyl sulfone monooxygenase